MYWKSSLRIFLWIKTPAFSRQLFFIAYLYVWIFLSKHITNLSTTQVWKLDCRAFWNFCWHWLSGLQKLFTSKVLMYLWKNEVLRFSIIFIHLLSNNNMNIHAILLWKKKFSWKCGRQHLMWHGYIVMSTSCAIW